MRVVRTADIYRRVVSLGRGAYWRVDLYDGFHYSYLIGPLLLNVLRADLVSGEIADDPAD